METSFTSDVGQIKYATGYEFGYTRALRPDTNGSTNASRIVDQRAFNVRDGIEATSGVGIRVFVKICVSGGQPGCNKL